MQHAFAQKERVEPRIKAMVRATMRDSVTERDVCVIDLSTRGILATTAHPPKIGEFVELRIGRNVLVGQVRWSSERRFGISLRDRVSVASLVDGGKCNARLASNCGTKPAGFGLAGSGLSGQIASNVDKVQRMTQLAMLTAALAGAAYLIMGVSSEGFNPISKAMHDVNEERLVTADPAPSS